MSGNGWRSLTLSVCVMILIYTVLGIVLAGVL
ncbi:hypothetical protein kpv79_71 [Klebsiella phage vB_KpnM_KpV79]|uniref:Uncharacterized protein n=1 Tax=Klebsiella phage vB_KpnM_KpV79 TaxID=2041212 RepID=A0A291LBV5_9CAUD|nr:hypothetical protein FDI70_gp71 [Klebsiella phage vB_KpnM_KpV79]ATI16524.1 hypothetical protein kpv79_71 [Klebsiella phage vB_KpnM_KpV79]